MELRSHSSRTFPLQGASLLATGKEQLLVGLVEKAAAAAALDRARGHLAAGEDHVWPCLTKSAEIERGAAAGDLPKSGTRVGGRRVREEAAGDASKATRRSRPSRWSPRRGRSCRWAAAGSGGAGWPWSRVGPYGGCRRWLGWFLPRATEEGGRDRDGGISTRFRNVRSFLQIWK